MTPDDNPILSQVALGYSPLIDRERAVVATRLTVVPLRPDATLAAAPLIEAVQGVWPEAGGRVSLNIVSEQLLKEMLASELPANLMVEVPAFMAADQAQADALCALHARGTTLLIKGRPLGALPRRVMPCFKYSILDAAEVATAAHSPAAISAAATGALLVRSGIRTLAEMDAAFARGAHAVLGWPLDDELLAPGAAGARKAAAPGMQVIVDLIRQVDQGEPIEKLDATLKRDPPLAFKLLRYINSPAFGLRVEINSFQHAIMMLGYARLKRWLALLLATASKDVNMKPVMFAAVRRGLLMEELARGTGDDEMRGELFICGVFSLLDRLFQQPFSQLLASIPVPDRVQQALADQSGPYAPYLGIVEAIEGESVFDLRDAAERLMMGVGEINRAQLRALLAANELA